MIMHQAVHKSATTAKPWQSIPMS